MATKIRMANNTILIVDDDPQVLRITGSFLRGIMGRSLMFWVMTGRGVIGCCATDWGTR